jgi:outer membrane protein assembly factor BamB
MKLDPGTPDDPLVWSVQIGGFQPDGGILGTPALAKGLVYVTDTAGGLVAVDERTGKIVWREDLPGPTWNSPVPIDDTLLVGDCDGVLHAYDISDPRQPPSERWQVKLNGCIESTPAVWHGMIWVGTRGGKMYGIGDA